MIERPKFEGFPKIYRISRECVITEKIDGTNAQIYIEPLPDPTCGYIVRVGSRNRWLTLKDDNAGFCRWAEENREELMKLGPGRHFGEWWGQGIQRNYGLKEKRFSLFNTSRWNGAYQAMLAGHENDFPRCCHVVPILYEGKFSTVEVEMVLHRLSFGGSLASLGFMNPEGIVIYHKQANMCFKKTLNGDGHKGNK